MNPTRGRVNARRLVPTVRLGGVSDRGLDVLTLFAMSQLWQLLVLINGRKRAVAQGLLEVGDRGAGGDESAGVLDGCNETKTRGERRLTRVSRVRERQRRSRRLYAWPFACRGAGRNGKGKIGVGSFFHRDFLLHDVLFFHHSDNTSGLRLRAPSQLNPTPCLESGHFSDQLLSVLVGEFERTLVLVGRAGRIRARR